MTRLPPARRYGKPRQTWRTAWLATAAVLLPFVAGPAAAVLLTLAAPPAAAQIAPEKRNPDQPIDITADRLEVQQDKQIAIFSGHVDAVQGDIRLRSDKLTVHYRQKETPKDTVAGKKPPAPAASGDLSNGAITLIEADGHVFVNSPAETATGDHGVYQVDDRTITLTGPDVVLTRGQNVLHGQRATMNLDTGRSVLDSPKGGGRVRGLFVPEKKNAAGSDKTKPTPAAPGKQGPATQ